MIKIRLFVAFVFSTLLGLNAYSQKYSFQKYSIKEGLPQNYIYSITQDNSGRMVIATGHGLSYFDGDVFTNVGQADGLVDNFVLSVFLDSQGKIWAGHYNGGISVAGNDTIIEALNTNKGRRFLQFEEQGDYVFGLSAPNRLLRFELNSPEKHVAYYLGSDPVRDFLMLDDKTLLAATDLGLKIYFFNGKSFDFGGFVKKGNIGKCSFILKTEEDKMVVNSENIIYELLVSEKDTLLTEIYSFDFENFELSDGNYSRGFLDIATNKGVFEFEKSETWRLGRVFNTSKGMSTNEIRTVFRDNTGGIWLGTFGDGIAHLPPKNILLLNQYGYFSNSLYNETTDEIFLSRKDSLFIGKGNLEELKLLDVFNGKEIKSICRINEVLYLGIKNDGLFSYDVVTGQLTPIVTYISDIQYLFGKNDMLWIGTENNGAFSFDTRVKKIKQYSVSNGLSHNSVHSVFVDTKNRVWFLSFGTALSCLDGEKFHYYSYKNGFASLDFNSVSEQDGEIYIATNGSGFYQMISGKEERFKHIPINSKEENPKYIYNIRKLGSSTLIVNSLNSVVEIDPNQHTFFSIRKALSSFELEFIKHPSINFTDKTIFHTNKGMLVYSHPNSNEEITPNVYIKELLVNGELKNHSDNLKLEYGTYRITFKFNTINLNHTPLFFRYKLEGYDKEWNYSVDEREAVYTGITNGPYSFIVQCSLSKDGFTDSSTKVSLTVETPFWKTLLFNISLIILLILGVGAFIQWRVFALRKNKILLEELVHQRTEQLEAKNSELRELTYAVSHDLKNPVLNISGLIEMLKDAETDEEQKKKAIEMLETASGNLWNNIRELLEALKLKDESSFESEVVHVKKIVEKVKSSFHTIFKEKNVIFETEIKVEEIEFDKKRFESILSNLISNSLKYSSEKRVPHIVVKTSKGHDRIQLSVKDNGIGIDMQQHGDKIFGMFKRFHDHVEGTGLGLHTVKSVVEKHGGAIRIDSMVDAGTTVFVYFPLKSPQG